MPVTLRVAILHRVQNREDRIVVLTIRSNLVFNKRYLYQIRILFRLKSYYPYPKSMQKCIFNNG